jgi:hypothetical protein
LAQILATSLPYDFFGVGPAADIAADRLTSDQGWGADCSDYPFKYCDPTAAVPGYPVEYVCRSTLGGSQGVCLHTGICTLHCDSDCAANRMCSCVGDSECVWPIIAALNHLDEDVSFQAHWQCTENMDSYSIWESVPDMLQAHCMCSYKHWYAEYEQTLDTCVPASLRGLSFSK